MSRAPAGRVVMGIDRLKSRVRAREKSVAKVLARIRTTRILFRKINQQLGKGNVPASLAESVR